MSKALTILSNDPSIPRWIDFELLRSEGIRHVAKFSGNIWTDHNLHDPGIAILEVLCYALADLGYRNNLSVEDLLAQAPGHRGPDDNFFSAGQLFTSMPVTTTDYRKMLMDVKGVRNAWLELVEDRKIPLKQNNGANQDAPSIAGLYKVIIEPDAILTQHWSGNRENLLDDILKEVEDVLHRHRNLCEDFDEIRLLLDEEIGLCGDLELEPDAEPEKVLALMFTNLQNFLSPPIKFYTLQELLEKKKSIESVFEGRPMSPISHGFIDTEELNKIELRTELHASDLYRVMMETEGVRAVRRLKLFNFIGGARQTEGEEWCLKLTPGYRPVISGKHSAFRIFKNVLQFTVDMERVEHLFRERISNLTKSLKRSEDLDRPIPAGRYRPDLGAHRSVQHEFPLNYRIGLGQLPQDASSERKSQKLQLKGYLMFFDQLLANYLAQLSHLRNLFSMSSTEKQQSYYVQELDDVPEVEKLLRAYSEKGVDDVDYEVLANLDSEIYFSTPEKREWFIRKLIKGFENGEIEIFPVKITDNERYLFRFAPKGSNIGLVSSFDFRSSSKAVAAAEPIYFLGTLDRCYRRVDDRENERYGLELINNPLAYNEYLRSITEQPNHAQQRRNRFLDHLLARFTEEFTDYTLIMFALERKRREAIAIIKDKEAFLKRYPELSHDRSKGFNYKTPASLWNSDNISGMERRVAGLMGIGDWERRNLCNFEVAEKEAVYFAEVKSFDGEVIFRSPEGLPEKSQAEAALNQMLQQAKGLENYKFLECTTSSISSFYLVDDKGNTIGLHPRTYSSQKAASQRIEGLSRQANDEAGYFVEAAYSRAGWFFYLLDEAGKRIFKNEEEYCSKEDTRDAWHSFATAALIEENYTKDQDLLTNMFGFAVVSPNGGPVTRFLSSFCTKKSRCRAIRKILAYFKSKRLNYKICSDPAPFLWQLVDDKNCMHWLLESVPAFKTEEQTKANFDWFISSFVKPKKPIQDETSETPEEVDTAKLPIFQVFDEKDEEGRHAFFYRQKGGLIVARSPWYKTARKRNQAKEKVKAMLADLSKKPVPEPRIFKHPNPAIWFFQIFDADGNLALHGLERFNSQKAAQWGFYSFLELAADREGFKAIPEKGGCRYTIHFRSHCGVLATHPKWYLSEAEAQTACEKLIEYIAANKLNFEIVREPVKWRFEIFWDDCAGKKAQLLRSGYSFEDGDTALAAAQSAIDDLKAKKAEWQKEEKDGCYSFCLKASGQEVSLASHPSAYFDEAQRQKVLERAAWVMGGGKVWETRIASTHFPKQPGQAQNDSYLYRLVSKSRNIAAHPVLYRQAGIRDSAHENLLRIAKDGKIPYSEIYISKETTIEDRGEWRFVLRDKADDRIWWQSIESCFDEEDAHQLFRERLPEILKSAHSAERYLFEEGKLEGTRWKVILLNCEGEQIAEIPQVFDNKEAAEKAADERRKKAIIYPVRQDKQGWRIEIRDDSDISSVLWEGEKLFDSHADAWKAFRHFLNIAAHPLNYQRINDDATRCYTLVLREVLLEDVRMPTNKEDAWSRANLFALETGQKKGSFLPFEQYGADCRFGFRAVSDRYILARHTRRYHSTRNREAAYAQLYSEARCRWGKLPELEWQFCGKGEELFFEIVADGQSLWRSVKGFTPGSDEGHRYFIGGDDIPKAARNYYLDLYEYARHADFYIMWEEWDSPNPDESRIIYRLGLTNMQGDPEMVCPIAFPTKEELLAHAQLLLKTFRAYPILKVEDEYRFQYYTFNEYWVDEACSDDEYQIVNPGFLLWESATAYDTPGAAYSAFNNFYNLVTDIANYRRSTESRGRYFSIEITDPAEVYAQHPLTYDTEEEMAATMHDAQGRLDSEGFHLIEHILLRPNGCPASGPGVIIPVLCAPDEDKTILYSAKSRSGEICGPSAEVNKIMRYQPGVDPYSFWVTIVLPWWPTRFQNPDFRNFFQNTLRREAPAHVGLRILWVSPENMCLFETKYKTWLEAIQIPGDCAKSEALAGLNSILFKPDIGGNPPPYLDEPGIGNLVVLDQTHLSF